MSATWQSRVPEQRFGLNYGAGCHRTSVRFAPEVDASYLARISTLDTTGRQNAERFFGTPTPKMQGVGVGSVSSP